MTGAGEEESTIVRSCSWTGLEGGSYQRARRHPQQAQWLDRSGLLLTRLQSEIERCNGPCQHGGHPDMSARSGKHCGQDLLPARRSGLWLHLPRSRICLASVSNQQSRWVGELQARPHKLRGPKLSRPRNPIAACRSNCCSRTLSTYTDRRPKLRR